MEVRKLGSGKLVKIPASKLRVDWDAECRSNFQYEVKQWLRRYWLLDRCSEEYMIPGSRLFLDLVNWTKRVIVEINGSQHTSFNKFFHNDNISKFHGQLQRDQKKREWAEMNKLTFVEIYPEDMPLNKAFFKEKYEIEF